MMVCARVHAVLTEHDCVRQLSDVDSMKTDKGVEDAVWLCCECSACMFVCVPCGSELMGFFLPEVSVCVMRSILMCAVRRISVCGRTVVYDTSFQ